jgi:branched-chain amino acid transport system permease protein
VLALIALMPAIAPAIGEPYYMDVFMRIMIWAITAISLNLVLGYGGMVSFGHALFLGIGGYTVGIFAYYEIFNGFITFPLALLFSAIIGLLIGAICLRTRGLYFIMITLAFAQMIYYLGVSVEEYGSDDGLIIYGRSEFAIEFAGGRWELDLDNPLVFYYFVFVILLGCLYFAHRLFNSRFGMVIRGAKSNEARMQAIGFNTYRYKLACFVIAGVMCGLAGALSANAEKFISPDMMYWTKSGELIFMVVLGGMGSLFGPVAGALVFLMLSEFLSNILENWNLIFGPFLVLVVLYARNGIDGLLEPSGTKAKEADDG